MGALGGARQHKGRVVEKDGNDIRQRGCSVELPAARGGTGWILRA
jgi:hypothetical protein